MEGNNRWLTTMYVRGGVQEMVALDRLAPQTWCVLGNCFSLQVKYDIHRYDTDKYDTSNGFSHEATYEMCT
jgi:hypothetical protein